MEIYGRMTPRAVTGREKGKTLPRRTKKLSVKKMRATLKRTEDEADELSKKYLKEIREKFRPQLP